MIKELEALGYKQLKDKEWRNEDLNGRIMFLNKNTKTVISIQHNEVVKFGGMEIESLTIDELQAVHSYLQPNKEQLSDNVEELFEIVKDWTYQDYSNERYVAKFTVEDRLKRKEALLKLKQHIQAQASKIKEYYKKIVFYENLVEEMDNKLNAISSHYEILGSVMTCNMFGDELGMLKDSEVYQDGLSILKGENNEENNNNE